PSRWLKLGLKNGSAMRDVGSGSGRRLAKIASRIMTLTHATQIQKKTPSFLRALFSCSTSCSASSAVMGVPPGRRIRGLSSCGSRLAVSGTCDPRVQDGVEEVHQEVHEDIDECHHEGHPLDLEVVARIDGVDELGSYPVQPEQVLDDECPGDERADVEARRREHRERRGPKS